MNGQARVQQSPQWQDLEPLYRALFHRDSPWADAWQVDEAVARQKQYFEQGSDADKAELFRDLQQETGKTLEKRFGEWLHNELKQRNWNQSDLARAIGSYPSLVSKWRNGLQRPRTEQCAHIAEALSIPLDKVLEAAGHRPGDELIVDDWLVESEIRGEILQLVMDIPEALLIPLIPMLRGLAARDVASKTLQEVRARLKET